MKILAVLYCYPPLQYPATMCYVKLVTGLVAHGLGVEVVTVDPETFYFPGGKAVEPTMMMVLPEGVKNHQIRSWEAYSLVNRLQENRFSRRLFYRFFEPRKREWTFPAMHYLSKLDFSHYDAILTCSQPHCNHLIGLELKRLTGKHWVAYLSDPWADMPWTEVSTLKIVNYNIELERQVIEKADKILFTSKETLNLVMGKYPDPLKRKCGILPHSFVPEWFSLMESKFIDSSDGRLEILHTGHFYGLRSPLPVFRVLERLQADRDIGNSFHFTFLGSMAEEHRRFVIDKGLDNFITVRGTIPYLESLALMLRSDYLLLVDAPLRFCSESVFLPSKLVDYLGAGKPIIGITPARGTTARVLRETGNIACDIADEEAIYEVFANLFNGELSVSHNPELVKIYHYLETSRQLADVLRASK